MKKKTGNTHRKRPELCMCSHILSTYHRICGKISTYYYVLKISTYYYAGPLRSAPGIKVAAKNPVENWACQIYKISTYYYVLKNLHLLCGMKVEHVNRICTQNLHLLLCRSLAISSWHEGCSEKSCRKLSMSNL
jgi:hypothetical protein